MSASPATPVANVWCTDVELTDDAVTELTAPTAGHDEVRALVRLHGDPVDFVQAGLTDGRIAVSELVAAIGPEGLARIERLRTAGSGLSGFGDRSTVSVVVCTRNRAPELRGCLLRLQELNHAGLEFLIVDNAPTDESTLIAFRSEVGDDARFRYVREPRPGLSCARNRGLAEATGEFIIYTDDDVRVDLNWVHALIAGFARQPEVACVTGLVCTATLSTAAEHYFDGKVSWSARCDPKVYDLHTPDMDALYPFAAGLFGTGASMAFRTETLGALGGFDEALGAGTRTAGGEDLDIFVRVIRAGHALAYEPSAIAWHQHRSDFEGLRSQMFGYGSGLTAFITKHLMDRSSRRELTRRIPKGLRRVVTLSKDSQKSVAPTAIPSRALLLRELRGMASGPLLYVIAKRNVPTISSIADVEVTNANS